MTITYIAGRIAQAIAVLWAAFTLTFVILYLLPSDAVGIQLSAAGLDPDMMTPAELAAVKAKYGLDKSMVDQYFSLLGGALHGDWGWSISKQAPVADLIADRIGGTLTLSVLAGILAVIVGTTLAYFASFVQFTPLRLLLDRLPSLGVAIPSFLIGLLLIQLFAFNLGWLPSQGTTGAKSLVLPVVTMAIPTAATLAQVLTRSFNETLSEPYIATARAKGLSRSAVQLKHAFRNAALPALTILGVLVGLTVTSAIVTETVFSRNGIGKLAQESVLAQDIPVVLAIVTLAAAIFVLVNLIVDLLYPLLDPRIQQTRTSRAKVKVG